jgi:hypothetical protein
MIVFYNYQFLIFAFVQFLVAVYFLIDAKKWNYEYI